MKKIVIFITLICISIFGIEQKQEGVGWLDIFSWDDGSHKPRILIIGDSIVRQYAFRVKNGLQDKRTVTRLSTSKSICSPYYLDQLSIAMTQPYAIILINNGLHDFSSSNETYEKCFSETIKFLKRTNPKSKIILLTTTGVHDIEKRELIVISRNKSLYKVAKEHNLSGIDLYSVVHGKDELWKDHYHFKPGGGSIYCQTK